MHHNVTPSFLKNKLIQEAYLSRWAKEYFYDKLTEQGFSSFQDKGLSWYKVINGTFVQTVYLFSGFSGAMLKPDLGFGCHPLFIPAKLPQKIVDPSAYGWDNVVMSVKMFPGPFIQHAGSMVLQSTLPQAGAELLDEIVFPHFSNIHSLEDAYQAHRSYYTEKLDKFLLQHSWAEYNGWATCREFVDEVIYMGDWDMLKYCERDLDLSWCVGAKDRKRVTEQRNAVYGGERDAFLEMLAKREKRFLTKLEKNVILQTQR